jgi:hypothetical protein
MTALTDTVRELDHRTGDDIDVRLLWDPRGDQVSVEVADLRTGELLCFGVAGHDAVDAFHHPYAYARGEGPTACPSPSRGGPVGPRRGRACPAAGNSGRLRACLSVDRSSCGS